MLRQLYETRFGVFDHIKNSDERPLSTVALYDTEENSESSLLHSRVEQYIKSNVLKYTGLNLVEFLDLPREIVMWIFKLSENKAAQEGAVLSDVQQKLDSINKDSQQKK